jgi:hypothetical protein
MCGKMFPQATHRSATICSTMASALSGGAVVSKMRMYGFQMLTFFCLTIAEKEEVSQEDLGF